MPCLFQYLTSSFSLNSVSCAYSLHTQQDLGSSYPLEWVDIHQWYYQFVPGLAWLSGSMRKLCLAIMLLLVKQFTMTKPVGSHTFWFVQPILGVSFTCNTALFIINDRRRLFFITCTVTILCIHRIVSSSVYACVQYGSINKSEDVCMFSCLWHVYMGI